MVLQTLAADSPTTRNNAGGRAYEMDARHALAQIAATGTLGSTFSVNSQRQIDAVVSLAGQVDAAYLAKLAVYARQRAAMKDMPAVLLTLLASRDPVRASAVFDRVIVNGKMLRTFTEMVRSGRFGRRSFGSSLKRLAADWINRASVETLLAASIGSRPSFRDVLRLVRPKPASNERRALYGWLAGTDVAKWTPATPGDLPAAVRDLVAYREATDPVSQAAIAERLNCRWDLLAGGALGRETWAVLARKMGPQALRMNLNTLARHGLLTDAAIAEDVGSRLVDAEAIRRSGQFPYQFFAAYRNASPDVPATLRSKLSQAAEIAAGTVAKLDLPVVIALDVSGSMQSPVTGYGHRHTSAMSCVDAAAVLAAVVMRAHPESIIVPFDTRVHNVRTDPAEPILSLTQRLRHYGGGGTNCSLPLKFAREQYPSKRFGGCVLVSDNESWVDSTGLNGYQWQTGLLREWDRFARQQRSLAPSSQPKLVCIDVQPNWTLQAPDRRDILNIGGYGESVFEVASAFLTGDNDRFVRAVESVEI